MGGPMCTYLSPLFDVNISDGLALFGSEAVEVEYYIVYFSFHFLFL